MAVAPDSDVAQEGDGGLTRGRAIAVAGLLSLAMGIGPYLLNFFSVLAPTIMRELGLSRTQLGALVTISFGVSLLTILVVGRLIDQRGNRPHLMVLFGATAGSFALVGGARTYAWLVLAAAIAGLSQATSNPVTNRVVAQSFPDGRRGVVMGVKQSGVQVLQFFAGMTLPTIALHLGWRGAAWLSLAFAALGLGGTYFLIERRRTAGVPRAMSWTPTTTVPGIASWAAAYALLGGFTVQAVIVYLPLYAYEVVGLSARVAGLTAAVVGSVGIVARVVWGRLAEKREAAWPSLLLIAAGTMTSVALLAASMWLGQLPLWIGATAFAATGLAIPVVLMLTIVRRTPYEATGRASGRVTLGLYGGFMLGPIVIGPIVDATGSYASSWLVVFLVASAMLGLSIAWRQWERQQAWMAPAAQ